MGCALGVGAALPGGAEVAAKNAVPVGSTAARSHPLTCPLPRCPAPPACDLAQKVDAELAKALAALETEKEAALKGLNSQVEKLSADILGRVLPEGVRV